MVAAARMTSRPPGLVRLLRRGGIVRVREAIRDEARDAMHEGRGPLDFEALECAAAQAEEWLRRVVEHDNGRCCASDG